MSYYAIIKYTPVYDKDAQSIIHRIRQPEYGEPGFYREAMKSNGFRSGRRRDATKKEIEIHRGGCCWAPWGLYYSSDPREEEWVKECERHREFAVEHGMDPDRMDQRTLPRIEHESMDDFFEFIGFDRKKRKYIKKESPYTI